MWIWDTRLAPTVFSLSLRVPFRQGSDDLYAYSKGTVPLTNKATFLPWLEGSGGKHTIFLNADTRLRFWWLQVPRNSNWIAYWGLGFHLSYYEKQASAYHKIGQARAFKVVYRQNNGFGWVNDKKSYLSLSCCEFQYHQQDHGTGF